MNNDPNFEDKNLPESAQPEMDFSKEIKINEVGLPVLSRRGVARLTGVNVTSIYKNLKSIADAQATSPALKPYNGHDFQGDAPLPDTLAFALITHYAYYAQRTTETARCHAALLGGAKFREWCYEKAGYKLSNNKGNAEPGLKDLIDKSLSNLEALTEKQNKLIEQSEQIISQHGQLINQSDRLISQSEKLVNQQGEIIGQQGELISQQKDINQVLIDLAQKEQKLLDSEIEAQARRSNIRVLPTPETVQEEVKEGKEAKLFLSFRKYDVTEDNIPLQHLARTLHYSWKDTDLRVGRNRLYQLFRDEGIAWEHNNEIDEEFLDLGYFVKERIRLPKGYLTWMNFCTPAGWSWLDKRFKTDWAHLVN